jgi:TonB family protein
LKILRLFWALPLVALGSLGCAIGAEPMPLPRHARLLAGCALPEAGLIVQGGSFKIQLDLAVMPTGEVDAVKLLKSSGSAFLDEAFVAASRACRFMPVVEANIPNSHRFQHRLDYTSQPGVPPRGVHGCFMIEYPPVARRNDEQGTVEVLFRALKDGGQEIRLARSSGSPVLDSVTMGVAAECLPNASVRAPLQPDQWYRQAVTWVLRD